MALVETVDFASSVEIISMALFQVLHTISVSSVLNLLSRAPGLSTCQNFNSNFSRPTTRPEAKHHVFKIILLLLNCKYIWEMISSNWFAYDHFIKTAIAKIKRSKLYEYFKITQFRGWEGNQMIPFIFIHLNAGQSTITEEWYTQ